MSRNKTRKRAIAKSNKKMRLAREKDIEQLGLSYTFHEVTKILKSLSRIAQAVGISMADFCKANTRK